MIGSLAIYANPNNVLFHSHPSAISNDPYNVIWSSVSANGLTPFNTASSGSGSVSVLTNCDGSVSCIFMTGDSSGATHLTTIALTKVSVGDLSIANSKNLFFQMIESQSGTLCQYCNFGYYLTMNGTIPNTANYDPQTDPSVVLLDRQDCDNTCGFSSAHIATQIYLLRNIGQKDTISSEFANSQCTNGSSGSLFMCLVTTLASTGTKYVNNFILNYTGTTSGNACGVSQPNPVNGPGCSSLSVGTTSYTTTTIFPWSNLQAQQLYFGIFIMPGNNGVNFTWDLDDVSDDAFSMDINLYTPLPPPTTGPQVDTSGFFGPIIKALISIGVFIVQNVLNFAIYLYNILAPIGTAIFNLAASGLSAIIAIFYNVIKTILNSIGSVLGLGNLGDNLFNLLTQLASAFTTLWGLVINTYSNLLGAGVGFLSALGSTLTNYWSLLTTWLTGLTDYLSLFWSTAALFSQISVSMLLSFWLLYGALRFSRSMAGGMEWYHTTGYFMMLGFSITLFFISLVINYVIIPIAHIVTSSSTTLGARPKIEVAGTSTP